jgi:hypothetical protein
MFGFSENFWKLRIFFSFSAAEATVNVIDFGSQTPHLTLIFKAFL